MTKKTVNFILAACLSGAGLLASLHAGAVAQEEDERAARIRAQMGSQASDQDAEAGLHTLRFDINNSLASISARLDAIEKDIVDIKTRLRVLEVRKLAPGKASDGAPADSGKGPASRSGMLRSNRSQITVCGSGCDARSLRDGAAMVTDGGTIFLEPGDYADCLEIKKSLRLVGKTSPDGRRAHLQNKACGGKGAIVVLAPEVSIEGLKISGIKAKDRNGACFRVGKKARTVLIRDVICSNSQTGLLGSTAKGGVMTIENSLFEKDGFGSKAHAIYINGGSNVVFRNVRIVEADDGHLLKTGAANVLVENCVLAALGGNTGRALDIYGGGKFVMRNSVLQLGPNTQNNDMMAYAVELYRQVKEGPHEVIIENNWLIYDDPKRCCRWLFNKRTKILGTISFRNNFLVGGFTANIRDVDIRLNKEYASRAEAGLGEYDGTLASLPKPGSAPPNPN